MNKPSQSKAKPAPSRKKSGGGTLIGLFIGIVIGLLCAFGVVLYLQKTPLPFMDKSGHVDTPPGTPGTPGVPVLLPGKPGEKPVGAPGDKPRFEFYKILPGAQDATPQTPAGTGTPPPAPANGDSSGGSPTADTPPPVSEVFYLQAGAFQKAADADNLKAKLALMGLETSVLEANVPDKGTMYRVRVGPFKKPDEMNRVRNQLSQTGIQASLVKLKETQAPPAQ